ncbi:MAG: CHAT domain-containing protein [Thermoanaerobaculia bacterium]
MGGDPRTLLRQLLLREIANADPAVASSVFAYPTPSEDVAEAFVAAITHLARSAIPPRSSPARRLQILIRELTLQEREDLWSWAVKATAPLVRGDTQFVSSATTIDTLEQFEAFRYFHPPATTDELIGISIGSARFPWSHISPDAVVEPGREYVLRVIPHPAVIIPKDSEFHVVLYEYPSEIRLVGGLSAGTFVSYGDNYQVARQPAASPIHVESEAMLFRITTPEDAGIYRLRCSVYLANVTLQSRVISIPVGIPGEVSSRIDYRFVAAFPPGLPTEPGPHVSLLLNSDEGGTHSLRYFGHSTVEVGDATFDALELAAVVKNVRDVLYRLSDEDHRNPGFDAPTTLRLRRDLRALAISGSRFYVHIGNKMAGIPRLRNLEPLRREPGGIELTIREDARLLLPISLVYDYPIDTTAERHMFCDVFLGALERDSPLDETPCFKGGCRFIGHKSIICPSGFWGFRHRIAIPVSRRVAAGIRPGISASNSPSAVIGITDDPRFSHRDRHLEAVRHLMAGVRSTYAHSREALVRAFRNASPHLVYLFCHTGEKDGVPYFHVGETSDAVITGDNLYHEGIDWGATRPLVFINGCLATGVTPELALNLVTPFVDYAGALGVVGPEVSASERLATAFGEVFLESFLRGKNVSESVRSARLALLKNRNPLGLIYVPFAPRFASLRETMTPHAA